MNSKENLNETFLQMGKYTIGLYYSPSDGVKDGKPWCIRLLCGDKEPFRHGIALEERYETREHAVSNRIRIFEYLNS